MVWPNPWVESRQPVERRRLQGFTEGLLSSPSCLVFLNAMVLTVRNPGRYPRRLPRERNALRRFVSHVPRGTLRQLPPPHWQGQS